jgi:dTDP-4-dehydrorhamnose reductase
MIWLIGNKGMLGTEVELLLKEKKLTYVASDQEVDITNPDDLHAFSADKPISWIINCAAYTAVDKAEDEQDLAFKLNTDGPLNIATVAKDKCAKLIHISTDYVFDGTKQSAYCETDAPYPVTAYGKSKYRGEVHIQKILREHFILRTAWLYGRNGNNFVYTMLRLFNERNEVRVVGDQFGSPTYVADLAAAIMTIVQSDADAYGTYHFTNEGKTSWYDFACEIYHMAKEEKSLTSEVFIRKIVTDEYPTKAKRPQDSYLSKDKFVKIFKISPRPWKEALYDFMSNEIRHD